jgi:hypothetical protein
MLTCTCILRKFYFTLFLLYRNMLYILLKTSVYITLLYNPYILYNIILTDQEERRLERYASTAVLA